MAQVCSPYHFLHFALENFSFFMFPMGLIFFFCFCYYSFLKSLLIAFIFFYDKGAAKKLSKFSFSNYWKLFSKTSIPQSLYAVSLFSLISWVYRFYVRFSVYSDCSKKHSFQTTFPKILGLWRARGPFVASIWMLVEFPSQIDKLNR